MGHREGPNIALAHSVGARLPSLPGACSPFAKGLPPKSGVKAQEARFAERSLSMRSVTSRATATEPITSSLSPVTTAKVIST